MSIDEIERRKAEIKKKLEQLRRAIDGYDPILYADTDDPDLYEAIFKKNLEKFDILNNELAKLDEQTSGDTPEYTTDDGEER